MESPRGRVLSLYNETVPAHALVEVQTSPRCARCAAGKGCGAGIFGRDGRPQRIDAVVADGVDIREGDDVRVELAPRNALEAALVVYGLPLAGAVAGAAIAFAAGAGDAWGALSVALGAAAGLVAGRRRLRRAECLRRFTPVVTARLAAAGR